MRLAAQLERKLATPCEACEILGLKSMMPWASWPWSPNDWRFSLIESMGGC